MKLGAKLCLFMILFLGQACAQGPQSIPSGTWNYKLLVNGAPAGNATLSNLTSGGNYIITSELYMSAGTIKTKSKQVITETLDFKPVKIETYNSVVDGAKTQNMDTIAVFKGREVEVRAGTTRSKITLDRDFMLDGNYTLWFLISRKFREGTVVKNFIYDPTIEIDSVIPVSSRLLGMDTVDVGGKRMRLFHVSQSLEGVKSADSYLDDNGVLVKAVIQMLNLKIELIKE